MSVQGRASSWQVSAVPTVQVVDSAAWGQSCFAVPEVGRAMIWHECYLTSQAYCLLLGLEASMARQEHLSASLNQAQSGYLRREMMMRSMGSCSEKAVSASVQDSSGGLAYWASVRCYLFELEMKSVAMHHPTTHCPGHHSPDGYADCVLRCSPTCRAGSQAGKEACYSYVHWRSAAAVRRSPSESPLRQGLLRSGEQGLQSQAIRPSLRRVCCMTYWR